MSTPKPISKTKAATMEKAGQKVWRLRDGTPFATRQERRAYRKARKEES